MKETKDLHYGLGLSIQKFKDNLVMIFNNPRT